MSPEAFDPKRLSFDAWMLELGVSIDETCRLRRSGQA